MKLQDKIAVMEAFAAGKHVESRTHSDMSPDRHQWSPATGPCWDWSHYDYRIKPKIVECWANVYDDGRQFFYSTKEHAVETAAPGSKTFHLSAARLVLEHPYH